MARPSSTARANSSSASNERASSIGPNPHINGNPRANGNGHLNGNGNGHAHANGNGVSKNVEVKDEWLRFADDLSQVDFINQLEMKIDRQFEFKETAAFEAFKLKADRLCAGYILDYFERNGIEVEKGKSYGRNEIKKRLNLLPKFDRFFDFMLHVLAEDQFISAENGTIEFLRRDDPPNHPKQLKPILDESCPAFKGTLYVLDHSVSHYSEGLTGKGRSHRNPLPGKRSKLRKRSLRQQPGFQQRASLYGAGV